MADAAEPVSPVENSATQAVVGIQQLAAGTAATQDALAVTSPNVPAAKTGETASFDPIKFVTDAFHKIAGATGQSEMELLQAKANAKQFSDTEKQGQSDIAAGKIAETANEIDALQRQSQGARSAAELYGTNPNAPSEKMVAAANEIQNQLTGITARAAEMRERAGVGFLDDPIQYLVNSVVLPAEQKKQDLAFANVGNLQSTILKAQAMTLDSVKIATATEAVDGVKQLAAKTEEILGQANVAKAQVDYHMAQLGGTWAQIRDSIGKTNFDAAVKVNEARMETEKLILSKQRLSLEETASKVSLEHLKIEQDKLPIYKLQQSIMQEDHEDKLAERKEFKGALDILNTTVGTKLSVGAFKLMDTDTKESVAQMLASGTEGRLGPDAAHAVTALNETNAAGNPQINYLRQKIGAMVPEAAQAFQTNAALNPGQKSYNSLKPLDRATVLQTTIDNHVRVEATNRPDTGGMYSPGPLGTTFPLIASAAPELAKAIAPTANETPLGNTSVQMLYDTQRARIGRGEISPKQAAAELAASYRAINGEIYDSRQMKRMAMQPISSYRATVKTGNGWTHSNDANIDFTNAAEIEAVLARQAIADKRGIAGPRLGLTPAGEALKLLGR